MGIRPQTAAGTVHARCTALPWWHPLSDMGAVYLTVKVMKDIIISEDLHELLAPEQSFLGRADIRVRTAGTNGSALALHRSAKADLLIVHLDSEDMRGEDLCRSIREDPELRSVSILLVCGDGDDEVARCIGCSANAYVSLPAPPAVLLQEAHRLLHIEPRKTCRVPGSIRMDGMVRGKRFTGTIENISRAGILFWSDAGLLEGDTVQCTFSLAGSRQLTVPGEVVRVISGTERPGTGYGVSFFDISTEAASAIARQTGEGT